MTDGSTAIVPQPTGTPVDVVPPMEYPVATTVTVLPAGVTAAVGALEIVSVVVGAGACAVISMPVEANSRALASIREICASFKWRRAESVDTKWRRAASAAAREAAVLAA